MLLLRQFFLFVCTFALYEDQIGKFDWRKELIGYPKIASFEEVSGQSEYVSVYTNLGILASLSARDGKILWRRSMPNTESVEYIYNIRSGVLSISSGGIVRFWDSESGVLHRELYSKNYGAISTCSRLTSRNVVMCSRRIGDENVLSIYSDLNVGKRGALTELDIEFNAQAIFTDEGNNVAYLLNVNNEKLIVQTMQLNDFSLDDNMQMIKLPGVFSVNELNQNLENKVSFLKNGIFSSVELSTGALTTLDLNLDESCKMIITGQTEQRHSLDGIILKCDSKVILIPNLEDLETRHEYKDVKDLKIHNNMVSTFISLKVDDLSYSLVNTKDGAVTKLKMKEPVQNLWLNVIPTKMNTALKSLTLGEDGSVRFISQHHEMWVREEALSEIQRVEIIDLPPDSTHNMNPMEWTLSQRISIQFTIFKTFLQSIVSEFESGNMFKSKTSDPLISTGGMNRDQFNLHKLILIISKNGNIYGIDSISSDIIWKRRVPKLNQCSMQTLTVSDTNIHEGNILIVGKCSESQVELVEINPMTGTLYKENTLNGENVLRAEILKSHFNHIHPAVILTQGNTADTVNARIIGANVQKILTEIESELKQTSFWLLNPAMGQIKGGRVVLDESGVSGVFINEWTFQSPGDHEISSIAMGLPTDLIHSQGRPLANRDVLYKYLNPNVISVVTESIEKVNVEAMSITLYLLDGVTGQILHSANHKRATGPVNMVLSENWVVYSYWAAKMHRTEVTSVEMYQGNELLSNETHWNSLDFETPLCVQKSFIVSDEITSIGVTQSTKGITNKAILMSTKSGNIVSLPRILLDPRRKLKPESTDREEGIIQYEPELKLSQNFNINYNMTIEDVETFKVAISGLESTCIVFAIGKSNLFWTRVQPSSMFDVLKDDFDHLMISVIMVGFVIGTAACRRFAKLKVTNRLWQ